MDLLSCIICKGIVEEPQLLLCLHSCCSRCAGNVAREQGSSILLCPVCDLTTDFGSAKKRGNTFLADQVRRYTTLKDSGKCSICREEGSDELADGWCMQCQLSFCSTCLSGHNRFNRGHVSIDIEQVTSSSLMLHLPTTSCTLHRKQLEVLCYECKKAKCVDCGRQCELTGHTVHLLRGPKGEVFLADTRADIHRLQGLVQEKSKGLQQHKNLVKHIQQARELDLDRLRTKKKYIIDALSQSYDNAETVLKECYDQLNVSATQLQSIAEQLEKTVLYASQYVSSIVDSAHDVGLLDQHEVLLSRLTILSKQLDSFMPIDVAELVVVDGHLPEDLDDVIASWMGVRVMATDAIGRCLADALSVRNQAGDDGLPSQISQLSCGPVWSIFQSPVQCCDMSVTPEGCLLLAALAQGLKEYSSSGAELSSWRPETAVDIDDGVVTVEALDSKQVVVGLSYTGLIVLLRRGTPGNEWLEDKRIAAVKSPAMQLSVYGDLIAVAQCRSDDFLVWTPGPHVSIVRLSSGMELYRDIREYDILSVTVTERGIITTSWGMVELEDGRNLFVVDSYSHRGDRLWRHESSELVWDVCTARAGQVLYLALSESEAVTAVNGEDGQRLKDVIISGSIDGLRIPVGLSIGRGQRMVLALLSQDDEKDKYKTIIMFQECSLL